MRSEEVSDVRIDTSCVRAVAVLLVMNSHLEHFYPVPYLADGGLLGLVLFFAASAFGVTSSPRIREVKFRSWMWHRLKRLYPAVIVTVLLFGLLANGGWRRWSVTQYATQFLYPTQYHFIAKIIPFYVVLFGLARIRHPRKYLYAGMALLAACLIAAWPDMRELINRPIALRTGQLSPAFLWLVFLLPTVLAAAAVDHKQRCFQPLTHTDGIWLALGALAYVTSKYLIVKLGVAPWLFPAYFAISIAFCWQLFRVCSHPQFVAHLKSMPTVWTSITWLSSISLESYVVHIQMMNWKIWQRFPFPANLVIFVIAAWAAAYAVHRIVQLLKSD